MFPGVEHVLRIRVQRLTDPDTGASLDTPELVDPDTLTVRYGPEGTAGTLKTYGTDPELVRDDTGLFHIAITSTTSGKWAAHVEFTGPGGSEEKRWDVKPSALALP